MFTEREALQRYMEEEELVTKTHSGDDGQLVSVAISDKGWQIAITMVLISTPPQLHPLILQQLPPQGYEAWRQVK